MSTFTTSDGTDIAFDDQGSGTPVICLAGLTRNKGDFTYVLPHLLAVGARVIRMDYRGRGDSGWAEPATYTIPQEAADTLELMAHLGLERAAIIGTSRGGLIAMTLAATAKDRLTGVLLNDIGPEIARDGIDTIRAYIGRNPPQKTYDEAVEMRATLLPGFRGVPRTRWEEEVRMHYTETPEGLRINYDPELRTTVLAAADAPAPDLWPLFDALEGLPLAALRGENSNLLTPSTFGAMRRRRPDMIAAVVPDRGHVPFLDEPVSLNVINDFLESLP